MFGTTVSDLKSVLVYLCILVANALVYILSKPDTKPRWRHDLSGVVILSLVILVMWFVPAQVGRSDICHGNQQNCTYAPQWFLSTDSLWLYTLVTGLIMSCLWGYVKEFWEKIDDLWSRLKPASTPGTRRNKRF